LERNTARIVAEHLSRLGYAVQAGIGGHGVVGVLRNEGGKTILTRAELDALPFVFQFDEYKKGGARAMIGMVFVIAILFRTSCWANISVDEPWT
jgi:hypothetical protein